VDAVARLCRGRTVLLVAHRLTTLASVERVAVVADGRVLEQGPPASLASSGAHYPRLVAAWSGAS
jgi:ABC-type multidrug transport system fused ATPase/permease subunit